MTLVEQPTARTSRKVRNTVWTAVWIAPVSTIGAGLVTDVFAPQLAEYHMQIELLISMALTGVGTWLAGYYTLERQENVVLVR